MAVSMHQYRPSWDFAKTFQANKERQLTKKLQDERLSSAEQLQADRIASDKQLQDDRIASTEGMNQQRQDLLEKKYYELYGYRKSASDLYKDIGKRGDEFRKHSKEKDKAFRGFRPWSIAESTSQAIVPGFMDEWVGGKVRDAYKHFNPSPDPNLDIPEYMDRETYGTYMGASGHSQQPPPTIFSDDELLRNLQMSTYQYPNLDYNKKNGGMIDRYADGGLILDKMSDEDYQAQMLNKAGLLDSTPEGRTWSGDVASVESNLLSPTRNEFVSDSFQTEEGAPQGTWAHLSERNGKVEDFIQPMMPTVNVRPTMLDNRYKHGGKLPGNRTGDHGGYGLEDGEFVLNKEAVKVMERTQPGFLHYINQAFPRN